MRLVDARGRPLTHLAPGELARVECRPGVDIDRCARPEPGCAFAVEGVVVESRAPPPIAFHDGDADGEFGTLDRRGQFRALSSYPRSLATYYRASGHRWGTFGFSATFDDTARVREPNGDLIPTYDDPPQESAPQWITIGPPIE
jgi:hypothetical protein